MSTTSSSVSSSTVAKVLPQALLGVGAVAVLVALWLLWGTLSADDVSPTDQAARNSIEQIGAALTEVNDVLAQPAIRDTARKALNGSSGVQALRRDLQSAGVTNLLDVRVFPPGVEDIEIGTYPEPDFTVIQMLLEARRQSAAPAEVHYPGTANENLAFARAVPAENADDGAPPAGYLFIRRPVSVITRRLAQPGPEGWLALQQDKTVIASNGSLPQERVPDGQATIADSRLRLHWIAGQNAGGASMLSGGAVAVLGLLLIGGGVVLQRRSAAPAAGEPDEDDASTQPPDAQQSSVPESAQPSEAKGEQPEQPQGDRQDLPDWMLDEQDGETPFDADTRKEASQERAPDDGFDDVPNLDEIYQQIDAEEAEEPKEPEPEATTGEYADAFDEGSSADAQAQELSEDDESLTDRKDFESAEDNAEPDDSQRPKPAAEEARSEAVPPRELDLDFAFSDRKSPPDQEPGAESDEAMQEPPSGEGLDFALEDEGPLPPKETGESDRDERDTDLAEPADATAAAATASEPVELPSGIFRPTGILGVVDEDLTAAIATDIGRALGSLIAERGFQRVAVARDGRFSGPIMLSAVIRGLRNSGIHVIEVGAVPTPLLWFAATELAEGCGVMVTASHHPPGYNGFRAMIGGDLIDPDNMARLARRVAQEDFASGDDGGYEQQDILERYTTRLTTDIQIERPVKVVVDCGNGVGGAVAPKLLQAIGADLIPLYCDVDGAFPNHRPDTSSPDDLEDLRLCVRNFQAELGIAFDGDADRLAVVTRSGEIIWPDRLLMLLAADVLATRPGEAVVFDVRSSGHFQRVIERAGGRGLMTASGQQPVAQRLRKEGAPLGGDMSGHLFINDRWYPFDDAVYAAARLLEILAADARGLEEMLAEQPQYRVSPEIVVDIERQQSLKLIERLSESDFGDALVTRIDGVRADWSDRWGLARVDADSGRLILRFGADEATALGRVRSEFRDTLLALEPKLPLPY